MAFVRKRFRKNGDVYYQTVFKLADGTQTSDSYNDPKLAEDTKKLVEAVGGDKALEILGIKRNGVKSLTGITVSDWLNEHVDHLTGLDRGTTDKYRAFIHNDIAPILGTKPLASLEGKDIALWLQWLGEFGAKKRDGTRGPATPKTIANKHGFLSTALAAAVPRHMPANPAAGARLPQDVPREEDEEMVCLTHHEFAILRKSLTEYWQPLVVFLAASGCRWGEASALRPSDINAETGTVRIRRAWTHSNGGYRLVKVKGRGKRTINVPTTILGKLDYSHEWLFVNRTEGPVRYHGFKRRVWDPAVKRSGLSPRPTPHDLRHTCASWMVLSGVPITVVSRHLGHQSVTTTDSVYSHLTRESFEAAANVIGKILD